MWEKEGQVWGGCPEEEGQAARDRAKEEASGVPEPGRTRESLCSQESCELGAAESPSLSLSFLICEGCGWDDTKS